LDRQEADKQVGHFVSFAERVRTHFADSGLSRFLLHAYSRSQLVTSLECSLFTLTQVLKVGAFDLAVVIGVQLVLAAL
jgi:hypothetical protein